MVGNVEGVEKEGVTGGRQDSMHLVPANGLEIRQQLLSTVNATGKLMMSSSNVNETIIISFAYF